MRGRVPRIFRGGASPFAAACLAVALVASACAPVARSSSAQTYPTLTPETATTAVPANTATSAATTAPDAATATAIPSSAPTETSSATAVNVTAAGSTATPQPPTVAPTSAAPSAAVTASPATSAAANASDGTANACAVKSIDQLASAQRTGVAMEVQSRPDANGAYQIYVANADGSNVRCLSCGGKNAPPIGSFKVMPTLDPSHTWIVVAVEQEQQRFQPNGQRPQGRNMTALLNGYFADLYAVNVTTSDWYRLTHYQGTSRVFGVLAPHFTPDGHTLVWSKIVGGPSPSHQFGSYRFYQAGFSVDANGVPSLTSPQDFTPSKGTWFEATSFSPDGSKLLFASDISSPQTGQDVWEMDWPSHQNLVNLTNSPNVWDEHPTFSPHGNKIAWMSSKPYPTKGPPTNANVKTELFIMNADGTDVQQITHLNQPGHKEYSPQRSLAGTPHWNATGTQLQIGQLHTGAQYPNVTGWVVTFDGQCG